VRDAAARRTELPDAQAQLSLERCWLPPCQVKGYQGVLKTRSPSNRPHTDHSMLLPERHNAVVQIDLQVVVATADRHMQTCLSSKDHSSHHCMPLLSAAFALLA